MKGILMFTDHLEGGEPGPDISNTDRPWLPAQLTQLVPERIFFKA